MNVWRLPDFWYWIMPLLVFCGVTFCAVKWRKYLLEAISLLSLIMIIFLTIMWVLSCTTRFAAGLMWVNNQPDGHIAVWNLNCVMQQGGIRIALSGISLSETNPTIEQYTPRGLVWDTSESKGKYPLSNDKVSLTKSDFVQKTLGFQICWGGKASIIPATLGLYSITVPHWFAMLLCLPIPALWLKRFLRKRSRMKNGLCLKCSYDLRGNNTDKCPECGTPIPPRKEIAKAPAATKPTS